MILNRTMDGMMRTIKKNFSLFNKKTQNKKKISYERMRVSGSIQATYTLHKRGGLMPGQEKHLSKGSNSKVYSFLPTMKDRLVTSFREEAKLTSLRKYGLESELNNLENFTYQEFGPIDDDSLLLAIEQAYRYIFGNIKPMTSEKPIELERHLRNGDINIRNFIRGIAKCSFYKYHFFERASQAVSIQYNFKHILGRLPFGEEELRSHIEIINESGFDSHIDYLIDSDEYSMAFGDNIVPEPRCFSSEEGLKTSSFIKMASTMASNASCDNLKKSI